MSKRMGLTLFNRSRLLEQRRLDQGELVFRNILVRNAHALLQALLRVHEFLVLSSKSVHVARVTKTYYSQA